MHPSRSEWVRPRPKTSKNFTKKFTKTFFSQRNYEDPNASECIRMRPSRSEWVQMGPNTSESFKKLAKTSKILRNVRNWFRENFVKILANACMRKLLGDGGRAPHAKLSWSWRGEASQLKAAFRKRGAGTTCQVPTPPAEGFSI